MPMLLTLDAQQLTDKYQRYSQYPQCIECVQYMHSKNQYVEYIDIPYLMRPSLSYYSSYKDKIATTNNDDRGVAYKHIDKLSNKVIYVTKNNEIIDTNLEQYRYTYKI